MDRSKTYDIVMMVLLVGSVAIVFWYETLDDAALRRIIEHIDLGLVVFFVFEWLWRVRNAPQPGRYAVRQSWELLGMVPLVLPLPAFLRALRLLRMVRILRVFGKAGATIGWWERIAQESSLHKIAAASGSIAVVGALLVWALEGGHPDAQITNFPDAMWWSLVTITTVGYGDMTPVTTMGRFVAAVLMITGIGTIGLFASSVASVLVKRTDASDGPMVVRAGALAKELLELATLHEEGKLSDTEYEAAKARILGLA